MESAVKPAAAERAGGAIARSRYGLFLAIAVVGCSVDLGTKHWIFSRLGYPREVMGSPPRETIWLVDGVLSLETSLNEGALFGLGQGQTMIFAVLSIAAAIGILYWLFMAGAARDRLLTVTLGLISGGILGNLYDRLGLAGGAWDSASRFHEAGDRVCAVRDWIHFQYRSFDWPVFNIADSLLVCGAALLVWHAFFGGPAKDETAVPPSAA